MNNKIIAIVSIAIMLATPIAYSQLTAAPRVNFKKIAAMGEGIAVSPTDIMDFRLIKAGIATVRVSLAGESTELSAGIFFIDGVSIVQKIYR